MTHVALGPATIDLGVVGGPEEVARGPRSRTGPRRQVLAAAVVLACLLALAASARGHAGLGEPLWTGEGSLNGFTLGTDSIYLAAPGGNVVLSREPAARRQRWGLGNTDLPGT